MNELWKLDIKLQCYIATNFIPSKFLKIIYGWNSRPYPKVINIGGVDYFLKNENCFDEHYEKGK